jgi:hypothetical protein
MLGYNPGTFTEITDLTNTKNLTLSGYHKESYVSAWAADTALAVLLKDLKATFLESIKHNVTLPFNALSSTELFN